MADNMGKRDYKEEIKQEAFTLPNLFSYFRLMLIPVFVLLYVNDYYLYALITLIVSWLSDVADGFIARRLNMVTDLGKVLDPLADKLTQAAMIVCVSTTYHAMWILVGFLAVKELAMITMGYYVLKLTNELNSARWYGKLCTGALYVVMMLHVITPNIPEAVSYGFMIACAVLMMFSLVMYMLMYMKKINAAETPDDNSDTSK